MIIIIKSFIGCIMALMIAMAAMSKYYVLAGLIPLFPAFALLAHYSVGTDHSVVELKQTIIFSLFSLIPYALYLITVFSN